MDYLVLNSLKIKFVILIIACFFYEIGFSQTDEGARIIKLDEAIQLGIQNNNQLKMAKSDVTIATENLDQTQIAKAPIFGVNASYNYIGNPKVFEGFYEKNITVDFYNQQASANIYASMPLYY